MNILVVSYINCITDIVKDVIVKKYKDANIDVADGTLIALSLIESGNYDIVIIDMMIQEQIGLFNKPILYPVLSFLKCLKQNFDGTKAFSLFDENETGERGKDEVNKLGYKMANFEVSSIEWEDKLLEYI